MTGKYIVKMYGITESNLVAISEHLYKKIMMCKKKKKKKKQEPPRNQRKYFPKK